MRRRLPSLTALRAFEAAARHVSFTSAAEELNVTQAAVSHQVKVLEDCLGLLLFQRTPRALQLTEEGATLADVTSRSLDRLAEAIEELKATRRQQRILTVGVTPTFGQFWLSHRLNRFWRRNPDIELRVHHSVSNIDLTKDADIAVRLGRGKWHGLEAEYLMQSSFAPYCSPRLLDGPIPLRSPEDLRHHTLLHAYDYELWSEWLRAAGVDGVDFERGPILDDPFVLEHAAVEGRGVALCPMSLLGDYLSDGRLIRPFDANPETEFAFYIVFVSGALKKRKVRAFRDFLLEEASVAAAAVPAAATPSCFERNVA